MSHLDSSRFVGVQALRGFAAMLVVLGHATQMVRERLGTGEVLHFGAAGVDIFFPISGFVMVVTTCRHWGESGQAANFLLRRLIRIVPLYWAATLLKAGITLTLPSVVSFPELDAWHVIASFLFIPAWDAQHKALPLVVVGWTLNYEMFFYVLFAIALAARINPLWWLSASLLTLGFAPAPEWLGAVGSLAHPILLEFVGGMLIGWAVTKGVYLPERVAPICFLAALVAIAITQQLPDNFVLANRLALWGAPGAVIVMATLSMERRLAAYLTGWPERIGDASYAIYLVHTFVLPVIGVVAQKLGLLAHIPGPLLVAVLCLSSLIAGLLVHIGFEKPITRFLSGLHRRSAEAGRTAQRA
jgi:exopolysaccharide production protein ExoZ